MAPGKLVAVNWDDDDGNGTSDWQDIFMSTNENDLAQVRVSVGPTGLFVGKLVLEVTQGKDRVKIWDNKYKGAASNIVVNTGAGSNVWTIGPTGTIAMLGAFPYTNLWVEGITDSLTNGDVVLVLRYEDTNGVTRCADTNVFTILKVDSVDVHSSDTNTYKIASVLGTHSNHFVCAKDTGDIILDAVITPTNAADAITWEADGATITSPAVGTDKTTAKLSSATSHRVPVRIKVGNCTCWEGIVWVVWVTLTSDYATTTTELHANNERKLADWPTFDVTTLGLSIDTAPLHIGDYFISAIEWRGVISPSSMITDADIPDLKGTSDSSSRHWDVTRELKQRAWIDGTETTTNFNTGNDPDKAKKIENWTPDDTYTSDEDNNPYSGPRDNPSGDPTGDVFSWDAPAYNDGCAVSCGATSTFERRNIFREWVQIKLGGTWYRCSDYGQWRAFRSIKRGLLWWVEDPNGNNVIDNTNTGF